MTYILSLISTDDNTYQQVLEWVYTGEERSIKKNRNNLKRFGKGGKQNLRKKTENPITPR